MAGVRSFLKAFVIGKNFDSDDLLKLTEPPSVKVFEFRVTFDPKTRIFGTFYRAGEFIAVIQKPRDRLERDGFDKWITKSDQRLTGLFPGVARADGSRAELLREFAP